MAALLLPASSLPALPGWNSPRSRHILDRPEDGDVECLAVRDVEGIDARTAVIAQPDRLRAQRESTLLARGDKCKTAAALAQEVGGAGRIGEARRRAGKKHEAGLVVPGAGGERMRAA